ncbi:MAG: acetoacetyl-CoA synthetase, partial [Gaiellaceae bacterium]|nr:acetoacetyl-CoA synthetase [Gaiellaceae bacterium]
MSVAPPIVWEPSPERIASATITRYREWLNATRGLELGDYHALWQWSVDELEEFWASIWEFFDVRASEPYERVLTSREMPGAEWFPGARLSYAEHVFRDRDDDALAISHASELRPLDDWTWGELRARAGAVAQALRESGVEAGDRVAAYLPNIPETIAAFLGCSSIGAIWSSCAPEFGVRSVVDRFAQIEPKVLLAVDGYRYGGKDFDRAEAVAEIERSLPTLARTLTVPYLAGGEWALPQAELEFAQLPFDHPLWVLYSSGTTGLPKAIVHSQGGILLEHLKKLRLHLDARAGDRVFWFTTTGWMMWNFLVGALLSDASVVLFDGNPAYPTLGTLWDLADAAEITCYGTSAGYIASCQKEGVKPGDGRDLSPLDSVGSTGSPLSPEGFDWVRDE